VAEGVEMVDRCCVGHGGILGDVGASADFPGRHGFLRDWNAGHDPFVRGMTRRWDIELGAGGRY
jgi:hypothetical protein